MIVEVNKPSMPPVLKKAEIKRFLLR